MSPTVRSWLVSVLVLVAGSCDAPQPPVEEQPSASAEVADPTPEGPVRSYERGLVFLGEAGDSAIVVPWLITAVDGADGVERTARAWMARGDTWERFLDERWTGPASRAPWRIVPRGPMRLVVGEDESLERLVFSLAPRELELAPGDVLAEWTGREGATFRLLEGALLLAGARTPGLMLDLVRAREGADPSGGSWAFLTAGNELQVVLDGPEQANPHQGWARLDFRSVSFPEVAVEVTELRPFEPARRDVPFAWALSSPDERLSGTLTVTSPWLEAGEGDDPRLPVDALYEVRGTLVVEGTEFAVRGLLRLTLH